MGRSPYSVAEKLSNVWAYIRVNRLGIATVAAFIPVFVGASALHLSANGNNDSSIPLQDAAPQSNQTVSASDNQTQDHQNQENSQPSPTSTPWIQSEASVTVNGRTYSTTTTPEQPQQSINKHLITDDGTTQVQIQNQTSTNSDGPSYSSQNVHLQSNSSSNSSTHTNVIVNQHSSQ